MRTFILPLFCLCILLAGCAPKWEKPGATPDDFDAAQTMCEKRGEERYPPALRQQLVSNAYSTPNRGACFGSPDLIDCLNAKSVFVPPQFRTIDDNETKRKQEIETCLIENGWRPVKE